ncbi:MAG: tetratricopeptide repeat protein [Nitrospirota bacterium]
MRTGIIAGILLVLSLVTFQRNAVWESEVRLFIDAASKSSVKARSVHNRGLAALAQDDLHGAVALLRKSLELEPYRAESYVSLGIAYARLQQRENAREMFERSLSLGAANPFAHFNLGLLYYKEYQQYDRALEHFLKARELNPNNPDVHKNLGLTYQQLGREDLARQSFAEQLRVR